MPLQERRPTALSVAGPGSALGSPGDGSQSHHHRSLNVQEAGIFLEVDNDVADYNAQSEYVLYVSMSLHCLHSLTFCLYCNALVRNLVSSSLPPFAHYLSPYVLA